MVAEVGAFVSLVVDLEQLVVVVVENDKNIYLVIIYDE
jgi:hypothetical protein